MKFTLSWLKQHLDTDEPVEKLADTSLTCCCSSLADARVNWEPNRYACGVRPPARCTSCRRVSMASKANPYGDGNASVRIADTIIRMS